VLLNPFQGIGAQKNTARGPTVGPHPKAWTRDQRWKKMCQRWHAR